MHIDTKFWRQGQALHLEEHGVPMNFYIKTFDVNFVLWEYFISHIKKALLFRNLKNLLEPLRLR
jgi:hypothetical protein